MIMKWWCTIVCLGLIDVTQPINGIAEDLIQNQCGELKAQEHLDLNEVMGKWYVVEIIEHKGRFIPETFEEGSVISTSRVVIDTCPIIKLRSGGTKSIQGLRNITLLWEEDAGTLEYSFWVSANRGLGVWNSDIIQNGTLADKPSYKQFVGTVHLMKAVASHIVITFCTHNIDGQKFSVLIGREHKLPKTDLRGVHKLLQRRNLQLLNIRESCTNDSVIRSHKIKNVIFVGYLFVINWTMFRFINN